MVPVVEAAGKTAEIDPSISQGTLQEGGHEFECQVPKQVDALLETSLQYALQRCVLSWSEAIVLSSVLDNLIRSGYHKFQEMMFSLLLEHLESMERGDIEARSCHGSTIHKTIATNELFYLEFPSQKGMPTEKGP